MDEDKILRAYTRLKGIKDNLPPDEKYIPKGLIASYHEAIDSLEKELDSSLSEFKIKEKGLINDMWYEKSLVSSKLDALLSYFEIKFLSTKKPEIGFKPPNKEKEQ
jgi:hypothetical protein